MDTFSTAYMIAVGLFVAAVWVLIIADAIGHYADRAGRAVVRVLARIRDRKVRRAQHLWHMQRLRVGIDRWHAKHIRTDPRTEHHR